MKIVLVAVGQRLPDWAQTAADDYAKRFPSDFKFTVKTVKADTRGGKTVAAMQAAEAQRIEDAVASICAKSVRHVALDERGTALSTQGLAQRLSAWQLEGQDIALLMGGPDGLSGDIKAKAHESIRLSDLTLPHALARVLLLEQLYRAWSINANHPYHRE